MRGSQCWLSKDSQGAVHFWGCLCPKFSASLWELLCASAPGIGSWCSAQTEVVAGAWQEGRSVQNPGLARGCCGFSGVVALASSPGDSHWSGAARAGDQAVTAPCSQQKKPEALVVLGS